MTNLVWHKNYIPRHALILWMILEKRFPTKDNLLRYGITHSTTCILYNEANKTLNRLLFHCFFSKFIWDGPLSACGISYIFQPWDSFIDNAMINWRAYNMRNIMSKMAFGTMTYAI